MKNLLFFKIFGLTLVGVAIVFRNIIGNSIDKMLSDLIYYGLAFIGIGMELYYVKKKKDEVETLISDLETGRLYIEDLGDEQISRLEALLKGRKNDES